jgi:hypothetical protein
MRERIRAQLQLHQLRHVAFANAFAMERRAVAGGVLATSRFRPVDAS